VTFLREDNKGLSHPPPLGLSGRVLLKGPLGGAFGRGEISKRARVGVELLLMQRVVQEGQ
jgi:hypothetical protein